MAAVMERGIYVGYKTTDIIRVYADFHRNHKFQEAKGLMSVVDPDDKPYESKVHFRSVCRDDKQRNHFAAILTVVHTAIFFTPLGLPNRAVVVH